MIPGFNKIVETRILTAQKNGEFDDLEGSGKPLKLDDGCCVPEELRLAYKVLKNADFVPPEIELKKEIKQTEDLSMGWCIKCHDETKVDFSNVYYKTYYPALNDSLLTGFFGVATRLMTWPCVTGACTKNPVASTWGMISIKSTAW